MRALVCCAAELLALACLARACNETECRERILNVKQMLAEGRLTDAERAVREVLPRAIRISDAGIGVLADVVGLALVDQGRYREADTLISASIDILSRTVSDDPRLARPWCHLAEIRYAQGRLAEAQTLCEHALRVQRRTLANTDPEVVVTISNLSDIHRERGQLEVARKYLEQALSFSPGEPQHRRSSAEAVRQMALFLLATGKPKPARDMLRDVLERCERARDLREMVLTMVWLSRAETVLGRRRIAESVLDRAAGLAELAFPERHPVNAAIHESRAAIQEALGLSELAEESLRNAVAIRADALGSKCPAVARTELKRASLLLKMGRTREAHEVELAARAILVTEQWHNLEVSVEELSPGPGVISK